ncbi:MAG: DEAD/DEAH box helicase [Bacillota bacterium]|nr:DEAD/DEAH box helicase [Bacillota bacterium]
MAIGSFSELHLKPELVQGITAMGFETPTPIQSEALPIALEGRDLIGQAQTGTGKTAAYGIPILQRLEPNRPVQALILCPTRELAIQVAEELTRIGRFLPARALPVYGGQAIERQIHALRQGPPIVVGTPGRLLDHLRRGTLSLDAVRFLVLDEADEMLDMGFIDDVEAILAETPPEHQTMLFSATVPEPVERLARRFLRDPARVRVAGTTLTVPVVEQYWVEVRDREKLEALCRFVDVEDPGMALVFCRTKRGVDELADHLQERGYSAQALHGDLSQRERDRVMAQFRSGQLEILVATDVAARGLDIEGVDYVFNYDIPQDPEVYVHRVGRTARAGRSGVAITFVTPRERSLLRLIERLTRARIERRAVPTVAEVRERHFRALAERVLDALEAGEGAPEEEEAQAVPEAEPDLAPYARIAHELLEQYESEQVVAHLLRMLDTGARSGALAEEEPSGPADFGDTGAEPGMVRLFIDIGRRDRVRPGDIVGAIAGESGIPGSVIGRIDIYDRFTFVEVPEEHAARVLRAMRDNQIRGKSVNVEPARRDR